METGCHGQLKQSFFLHCLLIHAMDSTIMMRTVYNIQTISNEQYSIHI